ncbi:MAG: phosphatidate cytidylyltransferase, partial [Planctomycetaceae bacterium]|nr:phosphatidate cytidylyltransferase [Planctomycetaceae bacterium]
PHEPNCWCSFISYVALVLAPVLLFPSQPEFSATVLAILAFGDGSAALGGILLRGPKLPWNHQKTWAGFVCFLVGSVLPATVFFWGETTPPVSWATALLFAGTSALIGDLVESIPTDINDNIRVGLAVNVTLIVMQTIVIGW